VVKALVLAPILRGGGLPVHEAWLGAVLLGQGGEFALIGTAAAMSAGLVPQEVGRFVSLMVLLSLFVTPAGVRLVTALTARREQAAVHAAPPSERATEGEVVIAGFGRVGQTVAAVLQAQGMAYWAFDSDARRVTALRERGAAVWFGNAARPEFWQRWQVTPIAAVLITMDEPLAALQAVKAVRRHLSGVPIWARARDAASAVRLRDAGATHVIPETLEGSLQLAAGALQATGLQEALIKAALDVERERQIQGLA
jgi:CPA2 family monovalent cation:H+ antiporter-2